MGSPVVSYSDLPAGAQVYSDLPPGASLAPKQAQQPGFLENLGHTFGIGAQEDEARKQQLMQHPIASLFEAMGGPAVQVARMIYGQGRQTAGELGQAGTSLMQGNPSMATAHAVNAIPLVGQGMQRMDAETTTHPDQSWLEQLKATLTPGNIGTAIGTSAQVAPLLLGAADQIAPGRPVIPNPSLVKPKLPSPVSPTELSARSINQAINPRVASSQNLIDALQEHGGDVTDYAQRNGIGIRGALDYSKAAQGAADETYGQYRGILDPVADKTVPVPAEYQGSLTNTPFSESGRYANLGQLDSRLGDINNLKAAAFNNTTGQGTMTALEKIGLDTEHAKIADILHQSLADANGIAPEDVAGLRTKFGKLNTIADQTNASVNAKSGLQANINQGTRNVPLSTGGAVIEGINRLRGGPQAIADRALVKAIAKSPLNPTTPPPSGISPTEPPAIKPRLSLAQAAGIKVEPNPLRPIAMDPEAARAQVSTMNKSLARRESILMDQASEARANNLVRSLREQELLGPARKLQQSASSSLSPRLADILERTGR